MGKEIKMVKFELPYKKPKEILKELDTKKNENLNTIEILEESLLKLRGFIFKTPKPLTPVVVSFSGGLDSVITTAILLEKYRLRIYPFFVRRAQRAIIPEQRSVDYFTYFFRKKYPRLFCAPFKITVPIPAIEIKNNLKNNSSIGHPMRNSIIMEYGVQHAVSLKNSKRVDVKTLFCSTTASDQLLHSSLTALRSLMFHICVDMGDWNWQLTSIAVEKELGYYFGKDVLIKWAYQYDLPLEKTRSCIESKMRHCGKCKSCITRKQAFKMANVPDLTEYFE